MNRIAQIFVVLVVIGCGRSLKKPNSIELISDESRQDSIFSKLLVITNNVLSENIQEDSLAFLVLPVQASCPGCRNKTIDSIFEHRNSLADRHYVIISANGGRKTINGYFQENDKELPIIENRLFLDSTNLALDFNLYEKEPTIYYTVNKKAFKKVTAVPATVKDDLREFFSGTRDEKKLVKN